MIYTGGSRIFLGGGALVSCSTSTPINHIVFFAQYQLYQKTAGHLGRVGGGGSAHPLHPPPRSAPDLQCTYDVNNVYRDADFLSVS